MSKIFSPYIALNASLAHRRAHGGPPTAQSTEARPAALREAMEGLARELDILATDPPEWDASRAYADAAARIRAALEGVT